MHGIKKSKHVWAAHNAASSSPRSDTELVGAVGFYSMVAMTLNAFAVSVPGGKEPLT